jgi:hypothetical protein
LKLEPEQFERLVRAVIQRLAQDPKAAHLWHWHSRPDCGDNPAGLERRQHLGALLALLGGAAAPGVLAACGHLSSPHICGDDPCASDGGFDDAAGDTGVCGDDPCACADDPCAG